MVFKPLSRSPAIVCRNHSWVHAEAIITRNKAKPASGPGREYQPLSVSTCESGRKRKSSWAQQNSTSPLKRHPAQTSRGAPISSAVRFAIEPPLIEQAMRRTITAAVANQYREPVNHRALNLSSCRSGTPMTFDSHLAPMRSGSAKAPGGVAGEAT